MKSFKKVSKRLTILFVLLCGVKMAYGDGVYDMEKWQAEKVLSYLKGEEYVVSYCDCCDNFAMKIIQVENLSLEPSLNGFFQIRLRGTIIAIFATDDLGEPKTPQISSKYYNELIALNYTFVAVNNKGIQLANAVRITSIPIKDSYETDSSSMTNDNFYTLSSCQQFINFPPSSLQVFASNNKYIDWYNRRFEKLEYDNLLIGSWYLVYFYDNYGTIVNQNIPIWRFNFKVDKTYFNNIGNGETGKWFVENDRLITLNDEDNSSDNVPFFIDGNTLKIKIHTESNGFKVLIFEKK
ncbi:MAG: hypothetical protein IPN88_16195 [Bacteroidetes bacterium]|nr:hypothetical protein [Bacteroidota bacterium]